jgi:Raf kinase inhibitor-like YbhB/YbcL family protein
MANDPIWNLPEVPTFTLESADFSDGAVLPQSVRSGIFGAGGDDRSPALSWSGAPEGTKSFVLTCYDPDAPTGSGFWHWAVYNIPADVTSLAADAGNPDSGLLPESAITVANEARLERFLGAAPPEGHGVHRYFFTVTALDTAELAIPLGSTPAFLGFNLLGNILGRAQLVGTSETPAA